MVCNGKTKTTPPNSVFRSVPVFRGVPVFRCSGVPVFLILVHDYQPLFGNRTLPCEQSLEGDSARRVTGLERAAEMEPTFNKPLTTHLTRDKGDFSCSANAICRHGGTVYRLRSGSGFAFFCFKCAFFCFVVFTNTNRRLELRTSARKCIHVLVALWSKHERSLRARR